MKTACPDCGGAAEQIGRTNHTVECTEFAYQCRNKACNSAFTGVLNLRRSAPPGTHHFSAKQRDATARPEITDC